MTPLLGIRREDKNRWERRAPLAPEQVRSLVAEGSLEIWVQPSDIRIFSDGEYAGAGARIVEDLSPCPVIMGVKEFPLSCFQQGKTYIFFSHTIKGQSANMPALKRMMELGCQLIDYEKVADEKGRRLIFFGRHAGLAGMIDTLWALGRRLDGEGCPNPFSAIKQALHYGDLEEAKAAVARVGAEIRVKGLPRGLSPLTCGFTGYGNVSLGAQEIFDLLPVQEVAPEELKDLTPGEGRQVYKVVFKEAHMVAPREAGGAFRLQEYYDHPERYRACFETYLPKLTLLVNCVYWESRYPRLVNLEGLRRLFSGEAPALRVIGDVSCDVAGSMECTVKCTEQDNPVYTYDPLTGRITDGFEGRGPVVLAVDNLPCELSRESTLSFGEALMPFIPALAGADYAVGLTENSLPAPLKRALVLYQGELTPPYEYLKGYLELVN